MFFMAGVNVVVLGRGRGGRSEVEAPTLGIRVVVDDSFFTDEELLTRPQIILSSRMSGGLVEIKSGDPTSKDETDGKVASDYRKAYSSGKKNCARLNNDAKMYGHFWMPVEYYGDLKRWQKGDGELRQRVVSDEKVVGA